VILSAGSYGSPAILLRSGVGPADQLIALGIGVVADLPVGRRLLDHPYFHTAHALAPGHLEMTPAVGAILWAASSEAAPGELDLNITATHLIPPSYSPTGGVIALSASVVLPESTGTVKLASRDPGAAPLIDCNFLATGRDARRMLEGVKLARDFARSPDLASLIADELTPGDAVADDSALAAFIAGNLATYYHPSSTAHGRAGRPAGRRGRGRRRQGDQRTAGRRCLDHPRHPVHGPQPHRHDAGRTRLPARLPGLRRL